jgi:pimeloyl-ACP methyl ester carboxylesterase
MRRAAVALILGLVMATAGLVPAGAVPAGAGAAAPKVPALHWTACGGPYQCTRAQVPLDYDDPGGPQISLALMRLPASDPAHRIGSLFLNPGGPGGSGVDIVAQGLAQVIWTPRVRARFDIVGFDPRGVARSTPLRCFATNDEENHFFAGVEIVFPYLRSQVGPYISIADRFGQRCLRDGGAIIGHMSTANVARDLDLLRQAVGDEKLTYDGISYGSILGSTYAALFPNRVRALVLDGVADPVAWTTGVPPNGPSIPQFLRVGAAHGSETTLNRFATLCDAAGRRACPLAGGSRAKLDRLRARLLRGPIAFGPGEEVTYDVFVDTVLDGLYATTDWPDLAGLVAQLYEVAFGSGDGQAPIRRLASAAPGLGYDNSLEATYGVTCSDGLNPSDPYQWPRAVAYQEAHGAPYFAADWAWLSEPCATWPAKDTDRYLGPFDRTPSAPVLLIGNRWDPATPYESAKSVDARLPRSRLLTLNGGGHTTWLNKSRCIDRFVERYLVTGALPPVGATCQPDARPFSASAATSRAPGAVQRDGIRETLHHHRP